MYYVQIMFFAALRDVKHCVLYQIISCKYFVNFSLVFVIFFKSNSLTIQHNPFIMLCLRSTGMGSVINEQHYKETILQRNYRKMTIKWSFSYNFFVKNYGKKSWKPQHDHVISKSVL